MNRAQLAHLARTFLPAPLVRGLRELVYRWGRTSYAQEGEDLILARLFEGRSAGFYVDIGAHHPYRFSNTCFFHKQGWRGINVDAMPGSMAAFRRARPADINLETGVGAQAGTLQFHIFNEPALNTFDPELARERSQPPYRLLRTVPVPVVTLAQLLESHLPAGQAIGFMSVDVEGHDLAVLQSNDWQRFRPGVILVETMSADLAALQAAPITKYLAQHGYRPVAKAVHSAFFIDSQASNP